MANDRIAQLEIRVQSNYERREAEIIAMREALAESAAIIGTLRDGAGTLEGRVAALESRPSPSVLSFWGPAIATASILGGLAGWAMQQVIRPIEADMTEVKVSLNKVEERQFSVVKTTAFTQAEIIALRKQVDAMDQSGSRRWVKRDDKE